jgi:hypothetical protein
MQAFTAILAVIAIVGPAALLAFISPEIDTALFGYCVGVIATAVGFRLLSKET